MVVTNEEIFELITAISQKDFTNLIQNNTYLPSLGYISDIEIVNKWLRKNINFFDQLSTLTHTQLDNLVNKYYKGLSTEEKEYAYKILNGIPFDGIPENIWEAMFPILVYMYVPLSAWSE